MFKNDSNGSEIGIFSQKTTLFLAVLLDHNIIGGKLWSGA
jgi:hypothetical protein